MTKIQQSSGRSRFPDGFRILKGKQEYVTYVDHSSIRIWASEVPVRYEAHSHSAIEIVMPHSGCSSYQLPEKLYQVQAGEILIVPSGRLHGLVEEAGIFRHLFLFEPNPMLSFRDMPLISEMMNQPIYLTAENPLRKQVSDLLLEIIDLYNRREPLWNSQCYAGLLRMYALLGKDYLDKNTKPDKPAVQRIDSPIMNSAMTYINEHFRENITLDQVASFTGFSKFYFSRTFRQFTGLSFPGFLARKRLNNAVDLLIRTDQSIQSISEASGFCSVPTFNRVFRKYKSCTPSQFRAIYGQVVTSNSEQTEEANI